jgi:hypothetical protein
MSPNFGIATMVVLTIQQQQFLDTKPMLARRLTMRVSHYCEAVWDRDKGSCKAVDVVDARAVVVKPRGGIGSEKSSAEASDIVVDFAGQKPVLHVSLSLSLSLSLFCVLPDRPSVL